MLPKNRLFKPQRFDGVEPRGFSRRIPAEENARCKAHAKAHDNTHRSNFTIPKTEQPHLLRHVFR